MLAVALRIILVLSTEIKLGPLLVDFLSNCNTFGFKFRGSTVRVKWFAEFNLYGYVATFCK